MALAPLVVLLAQTGAAQGCWDAKPNYNAIKRLVNVPKTQNPPHTFYFGTAASYDDCQALCQAQPLCRALVYFPTNKHNKKWDKQCYGRSDETNTMVPQLGAMSATRVPCQTQAPHTTRDAPSEQQQTQNDDHRQHHSHLAQSLGDARKEEELTTATTRQKAEKSDLLQSLLNRQQKSGTRTLATDSDDLLQRLVGTKRDGTTTDSDVAQQVQGGGRKKTCEATCALAGDDKGYTCDQYTQNTCRQLEQYGCDCSGCVCKNDGAAMGKSAQAKRGSDFSDALGSKTGGQGHNNQLPGDDTGLTDELSRLMRGGSKVNSASSDEVTSSSSSYSSSSSSLGTKQTQDLLSQLMKRRKLGHETASDSAVNSQEQMDGTCEATCAVAGDGKGYTCDQYTVNTCKQLEQYGCDCRGCVCKNDAASSSVGSSFGKSSRKSSLQDATAEEYASGLKELEEVSSPGRSPARGEKVKGAEDMDALLNQLLSNKKKKKKKTTGSGLHEWEKDEEMEYRTTSGNSMDSAVGKQGADDEDSFSQLIGAQDADGPSSLARQAFKGKTKPASCAATCALAGDGNKYTCDQYASTCKYLEQYGCDCSGCECKNDVKVPGKAEKPKSADAGGGTHVTRDKEEEFAAKLNRLLGKETKATAYERSGNAGGEVTKKTRQPEDDLVNQLLERRRADDPSTGAASDVYSGSSSTFDGAASMGGQRRQEQKSGAAAARDAHASDTNAAADMKFCKSTCALAGDGKAYTCDQYTANTCHQLEGYGCDCSGCACKNDGEAWKTKTRTTGANAGRQTEGAASSTPSDGLFDKESEAAASSGKGGRAQEQALLDSLFSRLGAKEKRVHDGPRNQQQPKETSNTVAASTAHEETARGGKRAESGSASTDKSQDSAAAGRPQSFDMRSRSRMKMRRSDEDIAQTKQKKHSSAQRASHPAQGQRTVGYEGSVGADASSVEPLGGRDNSSPSSDMHRELLEQVRKLRLENERLQRQQQVERPRQSRTQESSTSSYNAPRKSLEQVATDGRADTSGGHSSDSHESPSNNPSADLDEMD